MSVIFLFFIIFCNFLTSLLCQYFFCRWLDKTLEKWEVPGFV